MFALFHMPALGAHHRRRITAAVDKQDRLLTTLETRLHRVHQFVRQRRQSTRAHNLDAHVDHIDRGQAA